MLAGGIGRRVALLLMATGLCAMVGGCASNPPASTTSKFGGSQLRYYGGPKYPMWPSQ